MSSNSVILDDMWCFGHQVLVASAVAECRQGAVSDRTLGSRASPVPIAPILPDHEPRAAAGFALFDHMWRWKEQGRPPNIAAT